MIAGALGSAASLRAAGGFFVSTNFPGGNIGRVERLAPARPGWSYDDRAWARFTHDPVSWDEREVRLTLPFTP